jgi:hypothetical protein
MTLRDRRTTPDHALAERATHVVTVAPVEVLLADT